MRWAIADQAEPFQHVEQDVQAFEVAPIDSNAAGNAIRRSIVRPVAFDAQTAGGQAILPFGFRVQTARVWCERGHSRIRIGYGVDLE